MKSLKVLNFIFGNIRIVFILVLQSTSTFYGIMKESFILEVGNLMLMVKDKRWVKESNISQESINLRDFLLMEKEVVMEFLF